MSKIIEIEDYINRFILPRQSYINGLFNDIHSNRNGISGTYQLKDGAELMDMLWEIKAASNTNLVGKLVPERYETPSDLIQYLNDLRNKILSFEDTILENYKYVKEIKIHQYETHELDVLFKMIVKMIDYVIDIFDINDDMLPVHQLKKSLVEKNIKEFIDIVNSLLANLSYLISKDKEGYLHSNIILLLKLLGFDIIAEDSSNIGRIDAVIKFSSLIYIFEFKKEGDPSEALNQIKEKKYYEKFHTDKKEIIIVGAVFDKQNRRIENYLYESL